MAYDAATATATKSSVATSFDHNTSVSGIIPQSLIDLYVSSCVKLDAAWYIEKAGLTRAELREMENNAVDGVFDRMDELLEGMEREDGVEAYVTAPMMSEESWREFVMGMKTFGSDMVAGLEKASEEGPVAAGDDIV